jgi:BarA-like signal transduction histidine kinase
MVVDHLLVAPVEVTRAPAVVQAELEVIPAAILQVAVVVRPDIQEMAVGKALQEAAVAVVAVPMAVAMVPTVALRQEAELEY